MFLMRMLQIYHAFFALLESQFLQSIIYMIYHINLYKTGSCSPFSSHGLVRNMVFYGNYGADSQMKFNIMNTILPSD
jgi:hypothetical protein